MKRSSVIAMAFGAITMVAVGISSASDWATSEGSCYAKGNKLLSVGGSIFPMGLFGSFDYGIHDAISAGGAVGYNFWWYGSWTYHYIPIIVRGAFHPFNLAILKDKIPVREKFDVYVGPAMGWTIGFATWKGAGAAGLEPGFGGFTIREYIGARWHFSPKMSLFLEEGGGISTLAVGITFKLGQ
jgi:hypothetical protein